MMVEVFCGILGGANYANKVRDYKEFKESGNLVSSRGKL